jgi:HSP20 family protein
MNDQTESPATKPETTKAVSTRRRNLGFNELRDEMDRLWESIMPSSWRGLTAFGRQHLMPALDVFEKGGSLQVQAELPGIKPEDIDIEIADDALTITGEKKDEREVTEDNYFRTERSFGRFRRQITLPPGADTEHVEAHFSNGVLRIEVPVKAPEPVTKRVEIQTEPTF